MTAHGSSSRRSRADPLIEIAKLKHASFRGLDKARTGHLAAREVAFKLRRELTLKAPALKAAIKAEQEVFRLKRYLQQLDLENPELPRRRDALPEVRRGGKVVEVDRLGRQKGPNDVP